MPFDYFISGCWKAASVISHLLIHKNDPGGFLPGRKTQITEVIVLLAKGNSAAAIAWDYKTGKWIITDTIIASLPSGLPEQSLQCISNPLCLHHLIDMDFIQFPPMQGAPIVRAGLYKKNNNKI